MLVPRKFDTIVEEPTLQHANTVFGLSKDGSEHGGELDHMADGAGGNGIGMAILSGEGIPAD